VPPQLAGVKLANLPLKHSVSDAVTAVPFWLGPGNESFVNSAFVGRLASGTVETEYAR
jgi:hypothetical protein